MLTGLILEVPSSLSPYLIDYQKNLILPSPL